MKKEMNIGHLCTTRSFGGLEMNVLRLAQWMDERGHTNTIFCPGGSPLAAEAQTRHVAVASLFPRVKYFDLLTVRRLLREIRRRNITVLIVHPSRDVNLGVLVKYFGGPIQVIHIQHMQVGMKKKDPLHNWQYDLLDAWIAPLPMMKDNVLRHTNMRADRIHTIPFGIDLEQFQPFRYARAEVRSRFGIPTDAFVCGVVGRIDYGKGQEYFVRAVRLLHEQGLMVHGLIVGSATLGERREYETGIHRLVDETGLSGHIHIHPFQPDIARAYAAMDIFCLTSISETYGMVTLEAMAMEVPVVATNSAGTPDIVQDGVNGILVPPQNPHKLADAIMMLERDAALRRRLAVEGKKRVVEYFSHRRQCEMLEEILGD